MVYTKREYDTTDPTFNTWPVVLCAEIVQCSSTVTACIPYLKPFLESLQSGMIRSDDLKRRGMDGSYGNSSQGGLTWKRSKSSQNAPKSPSPIRSTPSPSGQHELMSITPGNGALTGKSPNGYSVTATGGHGVGSEWDTESQSSVSQMIKQPRTWAVDAGERGGPIEVIKETGNSRLGR